MPRPWDQQWSLRIQQVLALETDLLEYDDIFDGSVVIERKTAELAAAATAELDRILASGGAFANIEQLKGELVQSHADRMRRIESGDISIVGVNTFTESAPSPLTGAARRRSVVPRRRPRGRARAGCGARAVALGAGRRRRLRAAVDELRAAAESPDAELMAPTIALARAAAPSASGRARCARCSVSTARRPASAGWRRARRQG